ncbi:MAG: HAMP domain-containing protein [Elainellaceae cyanobacterium]
MTAPGQKVWDAPNPTTDVQDDTAVEPASGDQLSAFFTSAEDSDPVGHPDSKRKGLSISVKATALAALFGILPVLTVGFIGYRSANVSITGEIAGQELEEVEQIASLIGTYLQERIADASTIAGVVSSFPEIAGGLNAEEQSNLSDLQEFLSAQLASSIQGTPSYSGIGIFDRQGESLIQTVGAGVELNQDDVSYFEQAIETETATLSKPVLETAESGLEEYAVYIAAPVISAAERVESVVLARIALDTVGYSVLSSGVSEDEEEEGDEFYRLVDDSSNILQSLPFKAENPEIGQSIAEKVSNFEAVQEQREPTTWIGSTTDGTALIAYAPVSEIENLGWSVVASEGTAEAFAPQRQLLATILLGTTVTSIAAVLLGIVLAKRATRPIEQAAKTVELLGQGNLYARMPVRGDDEVAVLGRNINQMAGQIEGLLQTLRQNATQLGKQNQVLLDLARDEVLIKGDAQAAAQTFGAVAAATLDVERVSFWLYSPS